MSFGKEERTQRIAAEVRALGDLRDFEKALVLAARLHEDQLRKGTQLPYISHLLGVAAAVWGQGGTEKEAMAGLLHDAIEDQGGPAAEREIRAMFGDEVADIVRACSDTDEDPKPPWKERKEQYLAHLEEASAATLRVSLADKTHNARAILYDLTTNGPEVWERFMAPPGCQLWYYRSLAAVFSRRLPGPYADELDALTRRMAELAGVPPDCDP